MFGARFFGARFYGPRYFGHVGSDVHGIYFGPRFYGARFYGPRYFPGIDVTAGSSGAFYIFGGAIVR